MSSLATTSLTDVEQRSVDCFLDLLERELGEDLLGVWLYGSRARGEPPRAESDVDLFVVTRRGKPDWKRVIHLTGEVVQELEMPGPDLMTVVESPASLARLRATRHFLLSEVERDGIALKGGRIEDLAPSTGREPLREPDGLMTRTHEYLGQARYQLRGAENLLDTDTPGIAVAEAYFAVLNSARAALSERNQFQRTHDGTWKRVYFEFVRPGILPGEFLKWARDLQGQRQEVHYKCMQYGPEEAKEAYAAAERFVEAVERLLRWRPSPPPAPR